MINWHEISKRKLTKDYIIKNKDHLDWFEIIRNQELPIDVIVAGAKYINFDDLLNFGQPIFSNYDHSEETLRTIFDLAPKGVKMLNGTAWGGKLDKSFVREYIERFNDPLSFIKKEQKDWKTTSEWDYKYFGFIEYVFTTALYKPHPFSYTKKYTQYYDYATLLNEKWKDEVDQNLNKGEREYLTKMRKVIWHHE